MKGMNVTIVTTAADDNGARALLKGFGMPFRVGVGAPQDNRKFKVCNRIERETWQLQQSA